MLKSSAGKLSRLKHCWRASKEGCRTPEKIRKFIAALKHSASDGVLFGSQVAFGGFRHHHNQIIPMKFHIQAAGVIAITTTLAFAEDAPAKHDKPKPNPEAAFKKLDTNSDGSLSLDEFKASPRGRKNPAKAEEVFKKLDADSNGSVSLEEFKAGAAHRGGKGHRK
jgi:hypothetical protein